MEYFGLQKRGGVIASKIEAQDAVGAILCIELLNKDSNYYNYFENTNWNMICEGNDDLEIVNDTHRLLIQVKTSNVSKGDFVNILGNYKNNLEKSTIKVVGLKLSIFETIRHFSIEKLKEYQNIKDVYPPAESKKILNELLDKSKIDYKYRDVINLLEIDVRPFLKDEEDTKSIFSESLRKAYPIRDFANRSTENIYRQLINMLSEARRKRSPISKLKVLEIINQNITLDGYIQNISIQTGYKKDKYGYTYDVDSRKIANNLADANLQILRKIKKEWRKCYFKQFIISSIIGATKCPNCNHPLMANFMGLNGIACPNCDFNPYVTLFLGCMCGEHYEVIKTQPDLSNNELSNYIFDYYQNKETKCPKCSKNMLDEYWEFRLFILPFPYPFHSFNLKSLYYHSQDDKKDII